MKELSITIKKGTKIRLLNLGDESDFELNFDEESNTVTIEILPDFEADGWDNYEEE